MAGVDYSQFKGKPFQVVSKLGVRYTGIFDHISQEDQTICLGQVYNHGTEDRPTARKLAGSQVTLGWVRFHTESIESLALVENYVPPGAQEEQPIDPILASVSQAPPTASTSSAPTASRPPQAPAAASVAAAARHDLPPRPSGAAISAATALDRVQASLNDLSVDGNTRRPSRGQPAHAHAPEVPDAEFDFSKGTEAFEKQREGRKAPESSAGGEDVGEPELEPHPAAVASKSPDSSTADLPGKDKKSSVYQKGSFFDGLSGESSRISRNEERSRNYDTFGEAGGNDSYGQANGPAGGYGNGGYGRGRGGGGHSRGGYRGGQNQGQGGYGQNRDGGGYGQNNRDGYGQNQNGYAGGQNGYRGGRGRGGYRGGYQNQQPPPHFAS